MQQLRHILSLLLFFPFCLKAIVFDSSQKQELIEQGIFKLNALKESNLKKIQEGKTNELNFIVNLEPDNNTDYINDYNLPTKPKFLSTATVEQQLNNRLKQIFTEQFKECYLILISAFDVEIKAPVPEGLSAKDVFNKGKFFDEQSDIETHKAFHNDVVSQIANSNSISGNNRDCYVLSLGAYCGAFYANKVGCYYYWFTKKVDIQGNATVDYFTETYDYLNSYLRSSKDFKQPKSQDNMAEQVVTAFDSAAKNAKLKAQILSTHTSPELEDILENFSTTEDYSTLSLAERIHILKIFLTSLTFSSSETYINNTLRTTATENINDLLNALLAPQNNINGTSMLTRLFSAIQGDNYTPFIKDICNLVGRSTLDGHNLPEDNISYDNLPVSSFGINESWYRAFEWTDCWNRLNPSDPNDPENVSLNACSWTNFEKRFSNIQIENDGYIKVTGRYDSGQSVITETGTTVKTIETFERTYHPYDLVLFSNESSIETINEANTEGVVVVPALFLKFAYDKAFNQGIYDVAYINMSILGIFGVDEIMLASKALTKVPKMKSLLKWIWREGVVSKAGNLLSKLDNPLLLQLKNKVNSLNEANKIAFLDDFENATDEMLEQLQNNNLFEVWKNDVRSNSISELETIAQIPNIRTEYNSKVSALAQKKTELEILNKTKLEIAQELSTARRQLTIDYKHITPNDFLEWIFRRNEIEYIATGTGDKWGLTWDGALKKQAQKLGLSDISQATPQQLEEIYEAIANAASKTAGIDKMALGKNFNDFFKPKINSLEYNELLRILKKYRMYAP